MNRYKIFFLFIIFFITILPGIYGCGKKLLNITLVGQMELNRSNAIVVRIYQLRSDARFQLATVESFWKEKNADEIFLDKEFISKEEKILHPEEQIPVPIQLDPETKFLGVAADFYRPNKDKWRQVVPITKYKKRVAIVLGEDSLVITDTNLVNLNEK